MQNQNEVNRAIIEAVDDTDVSVNTLRANLRGQSLEYLNTQVRLLQEDLNLLRDHPEKYSSSSKLSLYKGAKVVSKLTGNVKLGALASLGAGVETVNRYQQNEIQRKNAEARLARINIVLKMVELIRDEVPPRKNICSNVAIACSVVGVTFMWAAYKLLPLLQSQTTSDSNDAFKNNIHKVLFLLKACTIMFVPG